MEQDASTFAAAVEEATDTVPLQSIQQLKGRFTFLWGMYKAHSEVQPCRITLLYCKFQPVLACTHVSLLWCNLGVFNRHYSAMVASKRQAEAILLFCVVSLMVRYMR